MQEVVHGWDSKGRGRANLFSREEGGGANLFMIGEGEELHGNALL